MKRNKAAAVLAVVLAASITAGAGTAAYAIYVKRELNTQNTLNIGNAQMTLSDEKRRNG